VGRRKRVHAAPGRCRELQRCRTRAVSLDEFAIGVRLI
jgi:hypothetical protein